MIKIKIQDQKISLKVERAKVVYSGGGEPYGGPYQVTPKIYEETVLKTKSKTMRDDVRVLKIPQFEVSNEAGGITLIMGDEYLEV